jgi:hypothetical protein
MPIKTDTLIQSKCLKNNALFVIGGYNVLRNLCPGFFHIVKDARVFEWRSFMEKRAL